MFLLSIDTFPGRIATSFFCPGHSVRLVECKDFFVLVIA